MWHLAAALRRRCFAQSVDLVFNSMVVESTIWMALPIGAVDFSHPAKWQV